MSPLPGCQLKPVKGLSKVLDSMCAHATILTHICPYNIYIYIYIYILKM